MQEGQNEHHPKDGNQTTEKKSHSLPNKIRSNLLCRLTPVQNGVNIRLVSQVSPTTLYIDKVGEDVDETEELDMVGMETAPRSGKANSQMMKHLLDHLAEMKTSTTLIAVIRPWPVMFWKSRGSWLQRNGQQTIEQSADTSLFTLANIHRTRWLHGRGEPVAAQLDVRDSST